MSETLRSCQILKPVVQCPCYTDCRPHICIDIFWSLDYRRIPFGWGFAILWHPCPYMMNTAMMFLTCQKDPSFLGFVQHSNSLWLWYRVHALWYVILVLTGLITERRMHCHGQALVLLLSQGAALSEIIPPTQGQWRTLWLSWSHLRYFVYIAFDLKGMLPSGMNLCSLSVCVWWSGLNWTVLIFKGAQVFFSSWFRCWMTCLLLTHVATW